MDENKQMLNSLMKSITAFHTKDVRLTDKYLSRTPFHPGYWVRTRIDNAISSYASLAHGVLFDVGCGVKPFETTFAPIVDKYIGLEYSPETGYRGNRADFCGDAAFLPLADDRVDTILCTEVMEHVPNPERTIEEFVRVLRPGGIIITTAPFFYPNHVAYDFFRYSPDGLASIMKRHGLTIEIVEPLSGTAVTLAAMFNLYWYDVGFIWTKWLFPIGVILRPMLWLTCFVVNVLGALFEKLMPSAYMSFNHLTIARKPEQ